jgi:UDPglucose 6-dehydrogenase
LCEAKEAEIIKYCENYWLMRQVDYWNDVLDIADTYNMSFHRIREGLLLDSRFSRTHSFVYKTNRGWSGKCLPKDMNALAFTLRQCGYPLETVEHLIDKNFNKWRKNYKNEERLRPAQPRWK